MAKVISCGGLLVHEGKLLICRPRWDSPFWNIPKGLPDSKESPLETALREIKEETNIKLDPHNLIYQQDLGKFSYVKDKDLYLFLFVLKEKPKNIKCNSFFEKNGKMFPEMVDFKWIPIKDCDKYFSKNLLKVKNTIYKKGDKV